MKTYFSKRHFNSIKEKKLPLKFPLSLRTSIIRILDNHSDHGGYNGQDNYTFYQAEESLKTFYGKDCLLSSNEDKIDILAYSSLFSQKGSPKKVIDAIEAWFDNQHQPGSARDCEKELNDLLQMNQSPWRFINGEAVLVNSEYLYEKVQARTLTLLKECSNFGALEEFQGAIQDLQAGETKNAVVNAHKSVESVMKFVLGKEYLTFGELLSELIKSGIIPGYYDEFLKHFEKLALGVVKERNLPARGHGQGAIVTEVPRSLAEFTVNLAGSMNLFIINCWIQKTGKSLEEASSSKSTLEDEDDLPF